MFLRTQIDSDLHDDVKREMERSTGSGSTGAGSGADGGTEAGGGPDGVLVEGEAVVMGKGDGAGCGK